MFNSNTVEKLKDTINAEKQVYRDMRNMMLKAELKHMQKSKRYEARALQQQIRESTKVS